MKKSRFPILLLGIFSLITLSGCAFIRDLIEEIDDVINEENNNNNNQDQEKEDVDNSNEDIDNTEKVDINGKTIIQQTYSDFVENYYYYSDVCPSVGSVNLLIIPVWFTDSSTYVTTAKAKNQLIQDIEIAYLGTNEENGWRSVKTYYEELSNNKLTVNGKVSDWYNCGFSIRDAGTHDVVTNSIVVDSVDWYFANNPTENRKLYDSDNNGYLDGVVLIYAAPNYISLGNDNYSNLWAYCYWVGEENHTSNPIPNTYFWASYDFMYNKDKARNAVGTSYGYGDTRYCAVDSHTYIHETGHMFGLNDYYDYSSNYAPAGNLTMQDCNVFSHDPFSTMALGWADPYVINDEDAEVTIGTFQKTKDLVLLTSSWNDIGSPFDEYLLFELYSPTGLNEFDCKHTYMNSSVYKGVNEVGIRIWHVDARLVRCNETKKIGGYDYPVCYTKDFTSDCYDVGTYGICDAFTNTYDDEDYGSVLGSKYDDYNLLQLIRCDTTYGIHRDGRDSFSTTDLFKNGSYGLTNYSKQFINSSPLKFNNATNLDYNFKIEISGSGEDATAKIQVVKTK